MSGLFISYNIRDENILSIDPIKYLFLYVSYNRKNNLGLNNDSIKRGNILMRICKRIIRIRSLDNNSKDRDLKE